MATKNVTAAEKFGFNSLRFGMLDGGELEFLLLSPERLANEETREGVVMGYDADKINIQFDKEGARTLVTQFVLDNNLMKVV